MSDIIAQNYNSVQRGTATVVSTVVRMSAATASFSLPNMLAASNSVVQLRRPGDAAVTVTQDDINSVTITGSAAGTEVLLVSLSNDPVVESTELAN